MGKYDTCMQEYLQNKQYFADLFNGCFFHGKPVICASELTEASEGYVVDQDNTITSEKTLAAVKVKKGGNEECFQCSGDRALDQATVSDAAGTEIQIEKSRPRPVRRRDTKAKLMRDVKMQLRSGTVLQVLAVENQSYINYGMPVRIMGYDAAEYNRQMKERRQQVSALWKQVESSGQYDTLAIPVTYAEYMSGILKTDRLHPVYTICLYSGTETWDGPRTLSDMMEFRAEKDPLREYFADYPANLFCVNEQEEFECFHTELRELLRAMNYRKDKRKFLSLEKDERYAHLSKETWEAIAIMTGRSFFEENTETYKSQNENQREEYDMCQALREIREDFFNEGKAEGREEGIKEGREEGHQAGIKEGREEGHEAGIKEGREEEREAGIRRLIEDNLEEKKTKEIIIQKLIRWFSMDEQTAQLYLDKYADSAEERGFQMVLD